MRTATKPLHTINGKQMDKLNEISTRDLQKQYSQTIKEWRRIDDRLVDEDGMTSKNVPNEIKLKKRAKILIDEMKQIETEMQTRSDR